MSAYVILNKERKANGRVWPRGALVCVPNCVARAMDRNGLGRKLKVSEAKKELAKRAKAAEKKPASAAAKGGK